MAEVFSIDMDDESLLFKDLEVTFDYCDTQIKGPDGHRFIDTDPLEPIPGNDNPGVYKGIEAYKFLAALNHLDKECFNNRIYKYNNAFKTNFTVKYKDYFHKVRFELGYLSLKNKSSVIEAINDRMEMYRINELEETHLVKARLLEEYQKEHNKDMAEDFSEDEINQKVSELQEQLKLESAQAKEMFYGLKADEVIYLEKHPEMKEYNAFKADTFKYVVEQRMLDYLDSLPNKGCTEHNLYFIDHILKVEELPPGTYNTYTPAKNVHLFHPQSTEISEPDCEEHDYKIVEAYTHPFDFADAFNPYNPDNLAKKGFKVSVLCMAGTIIVMI